MLRIFSSSTVPVYLDATARELLSEGRNAFARWRLSEQSLVEQGDGTLLFPWRGDRVLGTLALQVVSVQNLFGGSTHACELRCPAAQARYGDQVRKGCR